MNFFPGDIVDFDNKNSLFYNVVVVVGNKTITKLFWYKNRNNNEINISVSRTSQYIKVDE